MRVLFFRLMIFVDIILLFEYTIISGDCVQFDGPLHFFIRLIINLSDYFYYDIIMTASNMV